MIEKRERVVPQRAPNDGLAAVAIAVVSIALIIFLIVKL
jgi:hypothetical protein